MSIKRESERKRKKQVYAKAFDMAKQRSGIACSAHTPTHNKPIGFTAAAFENDDDDDTNPFAFLYIIFRTVKFAVVICSKVSVEMHCLDASKPSSSHIRRLSHIIWRIITN